jgi:N-formylglutamate amidohydrolase
MLAAAVDAFTRSGWGTAINEPFAGTYVPLRHFGRDSRVTSLMVEVRRDVIMDESTGEPHDGVDEVAATLTELIDSLDEAPATGT